MLPYSGPSYCNGIIVTSAFGSSAPGVAPASASELGVEACGVRLLALVELALRVLALEVWVGSILLRLEGGDQRGSVAPALVA